MRSLINTISKNITAKKVLILFIISSFVYAIMIFVTVPKLFQFSNGIKILDIMPFGYSYAYVSQLFTELGKEGRNFYLYKQIPIDMVYPFLFGITYFYMMVYFLQKINQWKSPYLYLSLLPFIGALFDYFENTGIILMLYNYPKLTAEVVQLNNFFTITKSLITTLFFIFLIIVLIIFGIKKVSKK